MYRATHAAQTRKPAVTLVAHPMNRSECQTLRDSLVWREPQVLGALAGLSFIALIVTIGNTLVVAAVFNSSKLRSPTNTFIVSLAVSDLMVGVAVLPFSATWEVFKVPYR